jgi:hypothetical protein
MAFSLDATISGTTANSYSTVADGDDYFAGRLKSTAWTESSNSTKEAALVQATRRINRELFSGFKASSAQSLMWPRTSIYDHYGNAVPSDSIPSGVFEATLELCLWYLDEDNRLLSDQDLQDFDSYNLGPISVAPTKKMQKSDLPGHVFALLHSIGPGVFMSGTNNITFSR